MPKEPDPELLKAMERYGDQKRSGKNQKKQIGIQLDADIVTWLKSQEGYIALVNEALRREMENQRPL